MKAAEAALVNALADASPALVLGLALIVIGFFAMVIVNVILCVVLFGKGFNPNPARPRRVQQPPMHPVFIVQETPQTSSDPVRKRSTRSDAQSSKRAVSSSALSSRSQSMHGSAALFADPRDCADSGAYDADLSAGGVSGLSSPPPVLTREPSNRRRRAAPTTLQTVTEGVPTH